MVQKPLFWLSYIVASVLLGYEFITDHVYGGAMLQLIYVVLSVYGWYKWTHKDSKQRLEVICHTTFSQWVKYTLVTIILAIICYFILKHSGDTDFLADAVLTAVCILVTYMASLKQIESWFVSALTVTISAPLCYSYHLYFTCLTYIILFILDVIGGFKWLSDYKKLTLTQAAGLTET